MKKITMLIGLFCLFGSFCAQAKLDGTFLHEVGRSYVTPHLEWGQNLPEKPLRVLFIMDRLHAREAAETAQRLNLDFKTFILMNWATIAGDDVYEGAMTGTAPGEKERELRNKLESDYDVIVISKVSFGRLPEDLQFTILNKLRNGTGIVYDYRVPISYRKVIAEKIPSPDFMKKFTGEILPKTCSVYQFGKGRLIQFQSSALPEGAARFAAYENNHALLIQAMLWAGGYQAPAVPGIATVRDGKIRVAVSGETKDAELRIRIRNRWNQVETVLRTSAKDSFSAPLPPLPAGNYTADLFVERGGKVVDFGVSGFTVDSPFGNADLKIRNDFVEKKEAIQGTLTLGNAPAADAKLRLSLAAHPCGTVWSRKEFPWKNGTKSTEFVWNDYTIPAIAGTLYAEVVDPSGRVLERTGRELFFPNRDIPAYFAYGWGVNRSVSGAVQLAETFGFDSSLSQFGPGTAREAAFLNQRLIPYMVSIALFRSEKTGGVRFFHNYFLPKELKEQWKTVADDACFYRPEVREIWRGAIRHRIKNTPQYGIPVYSLGDENNYNVNAGFGPSDRIYFRDFLKNKYQTITALNREWNSSHADFSAVPHPTLEEARKAGNWAAWNDHQEYMEKMYADIHHFCADEIRKIDPGAKVGSEGSMPGDLEQTIENLEYWGPYRHLLDSEAMRCFGGDRLRTVWFGYHNERGDGKFPILLQDLLSGVINGMGWFETDAYSTMCILGVDNTPSYPAPFLRELNRMRFGTGELLIKTPLESSGLALFWSHASKRAAQLDKRLISPVDSLSPLIRFLYRNGINFDMVSERTLKRLENGGIKTLILAGNSVVGEESAQAILGFVRNGGTVIADMNCGVLNRFLRANEHNPLAPLFGNLTLASLKEPEVRAVKIDKAWRGQKLLFRAEKALANPDAEFCAVRSYGKGFAVLLNFTLPMAEVTADAATPFDAFVRNLLQGGGTRLDGSVRLPDPNGMVRIRAGKGFRLIGAHVADSFTASGGKGSIGLPAPKHIYRCGSGYLGKSSEIKLDFSRSPLELFAVFEEKQPGMSFKAPASAKAGERIVFDFRGMPANRILHLEVFDPAGKPMLRRNLVVDTAKEKEGIFLFSFHDPAGVYRFLATDLLTGASKEQKITLQ